MFKDIAVVILIIVAVFAIVGYFSHLDMQPIVVKDEQGNICACDVHPRKGIYTKDKCFKVDMSRSFRTQVTMDCEGFIKSIGQ